MKLTLFTNHAGIMPALDYFFKQGWLNAVVATDKLHSGNLQIEDYCIHHNIPFLKVTRPQLETRVTELWKNNQPDMVIMMGFSYRIPQSLFMVPPLGFYNVHFSLLPAYKGPDPVFWQIRNGESDGGISIHRVTEEFDDGELVMQQKIAFIAGENWGICHSRYTPVVQTMLCKLVEKAMAYNHIDTIKITAEPESYYGRPGGTQLTINWDVHTAQDIENLTNAANPVYGGAITAYQQRPLRILEVSPVEGIGNAGVSAGTIVHADNSGIYVQCIDQRILRINILKLDEGYITGFKLAAMGVQKGHRFENGIFQYQETIK